MALEPSQSVTTPPRSPAHSDTDGDTGVSMSGWLDKQAEWKFVWNRRYFCLSGKTLSYREETSQKDKKCAQVVCIQTNVGAPNCFRVWTDRGGCWMLRAAQSSEYEQWTAAIVSAIQQPNQGCLSGTVKKCSAWTKQWRDRYIRIDGLQLQYGDAKDTPTKNKYFIASADPCLAEDELRIVTTAGEYFNLRFHDKSERQMWHSVILSSLRSEHTLRWQSVSLRGDGAWYCGATSHAAANFEGKHVVLFGGSATLPNKSVEQQRELVMVSLVGEHPASIMHPEAFEEGPNMKVKPLARESAACTFLDSGKFVLHGGISGSPPEVKGDAWSVSVATSGGWVRVNSDAKESAALPRRFGHTLHGCSADSFLVVGGFDQRFQSVCDVWRCTLNPVGVGELLVAKLSSLDVPRALHGGAALPNGSFVLVGGTSGRFGVEQDPSQSLHGSLHVFDPQDERWRSVPLAPPLPEFTMAPAVGCQGSTLFIWAAKPQSTPFLGGVVFSEGVAVLTEYHTRGSVPLISRGVSMHIRDEYCYVFGASHSTVERLLLPCVGAPTKFALRSRNSSFAQSPPVRKNE